MSYTKTHDPWTASDPITTEALDNIETQFDEAYAYFLAHGHETRYYTKTTMESTFWYSENDGHGSGADADLIYKSNGNLHASAFAGLGVPTGIIIMWSGSTIENGWHLCDGTNGTRDLRDKFIVGAGSGSPYTVGQTGGNPSVTPSGTINVANHVLTASEVRGHQHSYMDAYSNSASLYLYQNDIYSYYRPTGTTYSTNNTGITGSSSPDGHSHENSSISGNSFSVLPPYYSLALIQKI